ncbi:MAG: NAD-dependent epimerase/dehydratase family protein [Bacteroidota bacterium]
MKISVIGTNGLLSDCIGRYCNKNNYQLHMYGLNPPMGHNYEFFDQINLLKGNLNYNELIQSDMIVYAVGAGIQSNLNESPELIYMLNVAVPVRICNELKQAGYKGSFVSFGSYFEIGENTENHFFTELELLKSQREVVNDYSISKRMFSRFISSVDMPYKTWHFILPTIYGELESPHRLIPYTINALKTSTDIKFTSGEQVRQYIYIEEVAEIIFKAYKYNIPNGLYNIAGAETLTVKELVKALFNAFNKTLEKSVFGKTQRSDTRMKILQIAGSKLQNAIGYKPNIKITDVYDKY